MDHVILLNPHTRAAWAESVKDAQKFLETVVAQFLFTAGVRPETLHPFDLQKFTWVMTKYEKTGSTVMTPRFDGVRERLEAVCNFKLIIDVAPPYAGLVKERTVRYRDAAPLMKELVGIIRKMHPGCGYNRVREKTVSEIVSMRFNCGPTPYFCAAPTALQYWYRA